MLLMFLFKGKSLSGIISIQTMISIFFFSTFYVLTIKENIDLITPSTSKKKKIINKKRYKNTFTFFIP